MCNYKHLRTQVKSGVIYMCLMLCAPAAPLDWQYAELPSSASDAVLGIVLVVRCGSSNQI